MKNSDKPTATAIFRLDIDALEEVFAPSHEMSGELRIVTHERPIERASETPFAAGTEADVDTGDARVTVGQDEPQAPVAD